MSDLWRVQEQLDKQLLHQRAAFHRVLREILSEARQLDMVGDDDGIGDWMAWNVKYLFVLFWYIMWFPSRCYSFQVKKYLGQWKSKAQRLRRQAEASRRKQDVPRTRALEDELEQVKG